MLYLYIAQWGVLVVGWITLRCPLGPELFIKCMDLFEKRKTDSIGITLKHWILPVWIIFSFSMFLCAIKIDHKLLIGSFRETFHTFLIFKVLRSLLSHMSLLKCAIGKNLYQLHILEDDNILEMSIDHIFFPFSLSNALN